MFFDDIRKALLVFIAVLFFGVASACKSSGGLIGPSDETAAAAGIVIEANKDLKAIRVLYDQNETKRDELKKAMAADDAATVRKLSDEVVDLINEGTVHGKGALDKIDQARDLNINEDYAEYLRLKSEALNKQLEAFGEYRQAARKLRDNYDPKNSKAREAVKGDFEARSAAFQKLMERARDYSSQANELAKDVLRKPPLE